MFDISDIRNAEQALKAQFDQQKLISDISSSLIQLGDIDTLIYQTLEKVGITFSCSRVFLSTASDDGQELIPVCEWISPLAKNQVKRKTNIDMHSGSQLYEHFIQNRERVLQFSQDLSLIPGGTSLGEFYGASASFYVDGKMAGVFEISCENPDDWKDSNLQAVLLLANIFAMLFSRHHIAENLVEAKEAAEQASLAKSQFLSTMSHEIRTPLNAIIGLVQILLQDELSVKHRKWLYDISNSSEHLLSIINDVLDMSKIEAGKIVVANEAFLLYEAIVEVETIFHQRALESNLHFSSNFRGMENVSIIGDKLLLKQVLINLLSNAVKFTPSEGLVSFNISVESDSNEQISVYFEVTDTGIGMNPEQINKLFQPFEQTTKGISKLYGGTGLGLFISQKLVKMMNGEIKAESSLGKGSKFSFTLPFTTTVAPVKIDSPAKPSKTDFTGKTLMIAEDVPLNRMIITELLSTTGAMFVEVENGQQALNLYLSNPESYDLILMDMLMPVMDGVDATKEIRRHDHLRQKPIPIIALTANAFKEDVDVCLSAGMQAHISKPIDYDKLVNAIGSFL